MEEHLNHSFVASVELFLLLLIRCGFSKEKKTEKELKNSSQLRV